MIRTLLPAAAVLLALALPLHAQETSVENGIFHAKRGNIDITGLYAKSAYTQSGLSFDVTLRSADIRGVSLSGAEANAKWLFGSSALKFGPTLKYDWSKGNNSINTEVLAGAMASYEAFPGATMSVGLATNVQDTGNYYLVSLGASYKILNGFSLHGKFDLHENRNPTRIFTAGATYDFNSSMYGKMELSHTNANSGTEINGITAGIGFKF